MRNGKTIAAKREKMESDSARERARKHLKRRKASTVVAALMLAIVLLVLTIIGVKNLAETLAQKTREAEPVYELKAEIIDESGRAKVTQRMKEYLGVIEQDLTELGYKLTRAVLPLGMMREADLYLEGYNGYFKVDIDRDAAVQAEDIDRMVKYLDGREFEYVDVRVKGKAYWR